jgi:acetyl-CoA acetyltransferase
MAIEFKNQACIVGVGESAFGRTLDQSPLALQVQAFKAALEDAGLERDDIDGYHTSHGAPGGLDYEEFAIQTGCQFRWVNQNWTHGRWASTSLAHAAFAVGSGLADYVLVANTYTTRRGYGRHWPPTRRGSTEGQRDMGGGHGELDYHGLDTPGSGTAMLARNYMERYGATSEELGAVAVAFRKHAGMNPKAMMYGRPMTIDDYMASRMIAPPFRLFDYCLTSEGSVCLIVTTPERAREMRKPPVYITGHQGIQSSRDSQHLFGRPGLGVGTQRETDGSGGVQPIYGTAGVTHQDIDGLYVYDAFSSNLWMTLERFGFCPPGEAHSWIQDGRIELGGELPVNTNGGMMSEGDYTGFNHLAEMARQLRGECGERQVEGASVMQWATTIGDSLILTR